MSLSPAEFEQSVEKRQQDRELAAAFQQAVIALCALRNALAPYPNKYYHFVSRIIGRLGEKRREMGI